MNASTPPEAPPTAPPRAWVWHCTDESIAAGQISVLAALETVLAVGLYWWLSFRFEWHWFSFLGLIAAPMLLLRSEESVELGVEMLRRWTMRKKSDVGRQGKVAIVLMVGLAAGGAAYFLAQTWLPGHHGWALFWRAGVIGAVAVTGARAFAFAGAAGAFVFAAAVAVAVEGAVAAGGVGAVAVVGVGVGALPLVMSAGNADVLGVLLFGPGIALGTMLCALYIRWYASLRHLLRGIKGLPRNWRENLWVIDLTHPPELLPQAGKVDKAFFTVAGLWRGLADEDWSWKVLAAILIPAFYLPAIAYRWSLKASAWLWWPLALALTPPFEGLDGYARRQRAAVISRGAWSKLLLVALPVLLAWLLLSLDLGFKDWLESWSPDLAKFADKLLQAIPPPPLGLRYGLLWLTVLLAGVLAWRSHDLLAAYDKVLGSPRGYSELSDAEKVDFEASARGVERLRLLFIVSLFLLGEAVALAFLHARNSPEIERLVWPWLLDWL
jgi:hypothetical protein